MQLPRIDRGHAAGSDRRHPEYHQLLDLALTSTGCCIDPPDAQDRSIWQACRHPPFELVTEHAASAATALANWPTRPLRILVGFPPGSTPDIAARILNQPTTDGGLMHHNANDRMRGAASEVMAESDVIALLDDAADLLAVSRYRPATRDRMAG